MSLSYIQLYNDTYVVPMFVRIELILSTRNEHFRLSQLDSNF